MPTIMSIIRSATPKAPELRRKSLGVIVKSYRKLIDLIEAGAAEDAVKHWRLHLTNANQVWADRDESERVVNALGR